MFSYTKLEQVSVFQDSHANDQSDKLRSLIVHLLSQIKVIAPMTEVQIRSLSLSKLEELSASLFHFNNSADLSIWLKEHG